MGRQYWVIAQDGQAYGPADEAALAQWAREGRLTALSTLQDATTNIKLPASQLPGLAAVFGPRQASQMPGYQQPSAYQQQQTAIPSSAAYGLPQSTPAPYQPYQQPLNYQVPRARLQVPASATAHTLTSFSPGLAILFHILTAGIFSLIHFQGMHGRMPKLRPDDPGMGKAIGFMFIPFFNIYWFFFAWFRLVHRVEEQRHFAGLPSSDLRGSLMTAVILLLIPCVNIIGLVFFLVFLGRTQGAVNELVYATRGPNA